MASYNEIINILDQFATAHYQIKAFGNGEMDELVETFSLKDAEYPKMWANDQPNTAAKGEETFKFRIYMVDQVATLKQKTDTTLGESNINEVKSNTRQMCLDLVSFLIQNTIYPEITTDRNIQLTSFVDSFNDKLTGWYFDLDIRQALSFSACVIPMTGILPPPSTTCEPAIININGTFFINVPSGSTENIDVKDTNGLAVGSEVGGEWIVPPAGAVCLDATEIITDSASNVLYTNVIPSGASETQIITDGNITNSNGSINIPILAQGTEILPDVINIDSDGTPTPTPAQMPFTCTTGGTVLNYIPFSGQTTQYQTYDDGYYYQLGYYNGGILSNYYNLSNSDLTPWSHLKRFTGTTGGYYDEILTTYHNEDGTVSGSHALSFPNGLVNDYLTGFQWYYVGAGARTWTLAISETQALTFKGFSDWTIPTKAQIQDIEDNEMSNPYSNGIFDITGDMWSNTTVQANILQAFSFNIQGECTRDNKTIAKFRILIRKL